MEEQPIKILLLNKPNVYLEIVPCWNESDIEIIDEAIAREHNEATYQLKEDCFYEFKVSHEDYKIACSLPGIIKESKFKRKLQEGRLEPNIYVGTLRLDLLSKKDNGKVANFALEVRSRKTDYRTDYREMLKDITEKSIDLLFQINSPVYQSVQVDYENAANKKALYQQFSFVKSIIESIEFEESIHRIIAAPSTQWKNKEEQKDVRRLRRISRKEVKQLVRGSNRMSLPDDHFLQKKGLGSIARMVSTSQQYENIDTPENRFVKFVLEEFVSFFQTIKDLVKKETYQFVEVEILENKVQEFLNNSVFNNCSRLASVPLNSPVLQRKEGYRVVLKSWLMFDLAAKLGWEGGEDIYGVGKKNIATLYEYWLFFKLLEIVQEVFAIQVNELEELFSDAGGLNLSLKQGKQLDIKGEYLSGSRPLTVKFSFNRTFSPVDKYPNAGSWTRSMKPDYTLSLWPTDYTETEAEHEEVITHIHFDAKYKVELIKEILGDESEPEEDFHKDDKIEQQKGNYKRADLLKMHAYKDAIRRTAGAYVLYPGTEQKELKGFHEILPGLGAFAISPSKENDGTEKLKSFIQKILKHIENRASNRENLKYKTYEINKDDDINVVEERMPEKLYGQKLIPDDTHVLVGYYKSLKHLDWIINKKVYNRRINEGPGNLPFEIGDVQARYLLLHTKGDKTSSKLFQIKDEGPKVWSSAKMNKEKYPGGTESDYFIYSLTEVKKESFDIVEWDFMKLDNYRTNRQSSYIFTTTLSELLSTANSG